MQFHRILSSCLVVAALVGTPLVASADSAPVAAQTTPSREAKPAAVADAEGYAAREKQSPAAAKFEGGGEGVYIGSGALTLVLIVLLLVVIL
jgi:hypothetical protein